MENKCYKVSFNIGNTEIWASELYISKELSLLEMEDSKEEILELITLNNLFCIDDIKCLEILNFAISDLKEKGYYKEKENDFDFFVLEQTIFSDYLHK